MRSRGRASPGRPHTQQPFHPDRRGLRHKQKCILSASLPHMLSATTAGSSPNAVSTPSCCVFCDKNTNFRVWNLRSQPNAGLPHHQVLLRVQWRSHRQCVLTASHQCGTFTDAPPSRAPPPSPPPPCRASPLLNSFMCPMEKSSPVPIRGAGQPRSSSRLHSTR